VNYGKIVIADIANGIGCRTSIFVSGCTRHCKGCFNQETWDFHYGRPYTIETEVFVTDTLDKPGIDGISILGGEPMEPRNQKDIWYLTRRVKKIGKSIWLYSGYTWEELTDPHNEKVQTTYTRDILERVDVLVDGPFVEELKDISLQFRGSRNQRLIDMQKSLEAGEVVMWEEKG
jgi:anaerobic ribonucleoside-triphosphate reductase activating protein